ncbi:helix-turn-helix domain-containing protein [Geodermatophilus sp. URMC 63]
MSRGLKPPRAADPGESRDPAHPDPTAGPREPHCPGRTPRDPSLADEGTIVDKRAVTMPEERTSPADRPAGGGGRAWCPGERSARARVVDRAPFAGTAPHALDQLVAMTAGAAEPEPVGRMIRRLRLEADLTLEQLSETSGISDRALSDIERGAARGPQHRTVLAIATALSLTDDDRATMVRAARAGRRRAAPSCRIRLPLPRDVDDFTGRERELARITTAMTAFSGPRAPTVVITGSAGYGKTALAVRAAAHLRSAYPDQLFLSLGSLGAWTPDAVMAGIGEAIIGHGRTSGDRRPPRQLSDDPPLLLVLDDAAHESQVRAALSVAGPAAVLVTSRRSLAGLEAVERLLLDRLRRDDAVDLLAAVIPAEQTAGADLDELARLCDDVPLALRIAGNRLASRPGWTIAALTARLASVERRLDALTAGDLRMAAAIRTSVDELSSDARDLFRRLALVDGSSLDAGLAGALIGRHAWQAERLLDELTDHSLVHPAAGNRYTLHALLRLYAEGELAQESPATRAAIQAAVDDWLLGTAAGAARTLRPDRRTGRSVDSDRGSSFGHPDVAHAWLVDESDHRNAAVREVDLRDRRALSTDPAEAAPWLPSSRSTAWRTSGQPADGWSPTSTREAPRGGRGTTSAATPTPRAAASGS